MCTYSRLLPKPFHCAYRLKFLSHILLDDEPHPNDDHNLILCAKFRDLCGGRQCLQRRSAKLYPLYYSILHGKINHELPRLNSLP